MIRSIKAYTDSLGNTHATLEAAQAAELDALLVERPSDDGTNGQHLVQNKDKVIDILTTTEKSRPVARKINGGSKKRRAKAPAQHEELPMPFSKEAVA